MPLKPEPYDKEYMNHPPDTPALGVHDAVPHCGAMTEVDHTHPEWGHGRWTCTRNEGHIGRHEAGISERTSDGRKAIVASWAPR
ncbi:hypothetical protein MINTM005_13030 [Mycobacterium intracellulare]|uniref:hypothetical protein n=1 Tax=Mycobacterium intracellulare TaxID=1767 RepID=UPI0019285376|nr:hypothetical protein [Mycobacterium intracellulare]BCO56059.1 hypothetical protein MINTM005_13030 [Mycobacterium intracellulare]